MPTDYTNRRTDLPAPNPRRPVKRGTVQMMEDATRSFTTRSPGQQAPTSSTLQSTHPGFPHIHTDPMHHSQQTVGRPPYTGPYPFAGPDVAPAAFAHQIRPPDQVNIARYGPEALRPGGPSLGPAAMPFVNHPMGGPEAIQRTRQSRRSSTSNAGTSRKPQARRHDPMRENGVDEYASHSTETGNQLSQEELNNLAVQYKDRHSRQMGRKLAYQAKKDEVFCNFLP